MFPSYNQMFELLCLCVHLCPGFRTEGLAPAVWRGGESEALDRLNKHLDKKVKQKLVV